MTDHTTGRRLKFGLALDYFDERLTLTENFEICRQLVSTAEAAGFDLIYHGHHFMEADSPRFQSLPVLSRLAAEAGDMLILWADLLPLNHPVRVAEELATLDVLTGGRSALLGVLGYQRSEFEVFGVERRERGIRMRAAYEIVARMLAGETVTWHDGGYELDDIKLGGLLEPVSKPRPPIWVTAHNDVGLRRAAAYGDAWFISHQPTIHELREQVERYRGYRALREREPFHECELHGMELPLLREAFVADTTEEALRIAEHPMIESVGEYTRSDQLEDLNDAESYQQPFDEWRKDRAVVGDPEAVRADLERYQTELGIDCVVLKLHRKGIPFDEVLRAITLTGEKVIPAFT